jgi:hypothetical protein
MFGFLDPAANKVAAPIVQQAHSPSAMSRTKCILLDRLEPLPSQSLLQNGGNQSLGNYAGKDSVLQK